MPDRRAQLEELQTHLAALVGMLRLDPRCQWTRHFEACLHRAESLAGGAPQDELNVLSGSVISVFGGMGSFNDYAPWQNGQSIRGMEALSDVSGAVYQSALALRRVEA
jgi:hypothetical protein